MNKQLPRRKKTRLDGYDYSKPAMYFITICTENRGSVLSRIVGGDVLDAPSRAFDLRRISDIPEDYHIELLPYGEVLQARLQEMNDYYENINIDRYVIMPDHVHILLTVYHESFDEENGASRTSPPTRQHSIVSRFVSTLKRFCNKSYGMNIWQRSFHDHIIRNLEDYEEHINYICENPMRWCYDELYAKE